MEGNPLFKESQRFPSDDDILLARAKDDADLNQVRLEVKTLLSDITEMDENVEGQILTDLMQHRIEPLMVKAAGIGKLPSAQRHLETLKGVMESVIQSLTVSAQQIDGLRKSWMRETNIFYAQLTREDTPIESSDIVLALLCESIEDVEFVLGIYRELDPELIDSMRKMALLHFEIAELEGFKIPGADEKLALFGGMLEAVPSHDAVKLRPWWRVWK